MRELLGGRRARCTAAHDRAAARRARWRTGVFAQVTPYQVHVKLGHYNTLVWATDLATGAPLRGANVAIYVDRIAELAAAGPALATAQTDASGVALLPGTRELDPDLARVGYGCRGVDNDSCPRLFVRVDGADGMAVLPLEYRFEVNTYRASSYTVFPQQQREYGHLHAWGTTAQGVYRAGDTLDYKIYVRDQSNESLVAAPRGPYDLEIIDPAGQTVHEVANVELSAFGGYSGTYAIPQSAAVGWYQFRLTGNFGGAIRLDRERPVSSRRRQRRHRPLPVARARERLHAVAVRRPHDPERRSVRGRRRGGRRDACDIVLRRPVRRRRGTHDRANRRRSRFVRSIRSRAASGSTRATPPRRSRLPRTSATSTRRARKTQRFGCPRSSAIRSCTAR